jgi:hypothetical protein
MAATYTLLQRRRNRAELRSIVLALPVPGIVDLSARSHLLPSTQNGIRMMGQSIGLDLSVRQFRDAKGVDRTYVIRLS